MPLDMFVFLLNTRAGSRVSYSPLIVREQVMSHSFVLFEISCVVTAGPLLSAVVQIFHEKHMRSNNTMTIHPIISCIFASLSLASLVLGEVSVPSVLVSPVSLSPHLTD